MPLSLPMTRPPRRPGQAGKADPSGPALTVEIVVRDDRQEVFVVLTGEAAEIGVPARVTGVECQGQISPTFAVEPLPDAAGIDPAPARGVLARRR